MGKLSGDHQDVRFDFRAAEDLIRTLRAIAQTLDAQVPARNAMAEDALAQWRGRFADEFRRRMRTCGNDAGRLAEAMRLAAAQVNELSLRARAEQQRRQAAREYEEQERNKWWGERLTDSVGLTPKELPPPPQADPPMHFTSPAPGVSRH